LTVRGCAAAEDIQVVAVLGLAYYSTPGPLVRQPEYGLKLHPPAEAQNATTNRGGKLRKLRSWGEFTDKCLFQNLPLFLLPSPPSPEGDP